MNSEKVKEIKKILEERAQHKPINCNHNEYVEACGMYCRYRREFVADMGSKNGQTCKNCSDFIATDEVKEYADILTLINELESENKELKEEIVESEKEKRQLSKAINSIQKGFDNGEFVSKDCQTKTLKQFAKKLKEIIFDYLSVKAIEKANKISLINNTLSYDVVTDKIDELLKEYEK